MVLIRFLKVSGERERPSVLLHMKRPRMSIVLKYISLKYEREQKLQNKINKNPRMRQGKRWEKYIFWTQASGLIILL